MGGRKPKPKPTTNRFKIKCFECNVVMNKEHRNKHNQRFHADLLTKISIENGKS